MEEEGQQPRGEAHLAQLERLEQELLDQLVLAAVRVEDEPCHREALAHLRGVGHGVQNGWFA